MTCTQRKSAPTAATVEGTEKTIHSNITTTEQQIQALDAKIHFTSPGIHGKIVIYDFVYNHFLKFCESVLNRKPDKKVTLFIKHLSDFTERAYVLGHIGEPCFDISVLGTLTEEDPRYVSLYEFVRDLIMSAYRQGTEKLPYDLYRSMP